MNTPGKYTMAEVSKRLDLSEPWIRKVMSYFGHTRWTAKTHGKKVYFNDKQVEILETISQLRRLDLSLEEIKEIDKLERKIKDLAKKYFPFDQSLSEELIDSVPILLHIGLTDWSNEVGYNRKKLETAKRLNKREAIEFLFLLEKYKTLVDKLNNKAIKYASTYKEMHTRFQFGSSELNRVLNVKG